MKSNFKILLFSIAFLVFTSCTKDDPAPTPAPTQTVTSFSAMLMGSNEVPANGSAKMGNATLTFNNNTKIFSIVVTHDVTNTTVGHIHKGAAGTNGSVAYGFTNLVSPINYTSIALTAEQEADLMANLLYVNIHSSTFAGGEIRGQLLKGATTTITLSSGGSGGYGG